MKKGRGVLLLALALVVSLAGCATTSGGKAVVPDGPGQLAVQGYGVADSFCIAVKARPPGVSKEDLETTYAAAVAARLASDTVIVTLISGQPPAATARALSPADVISAAATVLAVYLQTQISNQFFGGIILAMQTDGNRQVPTEVERNAINARLDADCVPPE